MAYSAEVASATKAGLEYWNNGFEGTTVLSYSQFSSGK